MWNFLRNFKISKLLCIFTTPRVTPVMFCGTIELLGTLVAKHWCKEALRLMKLSVEHVLETDIIFQFGSFSVFS